MNGVSNSWIRLADRSYRFDLEAVVGEDEGEIEVEVEDDREE